VGIELSSTTNDVTYGLTHDAATYAAHATSTLNDGLDEPMGLTISTITNDGTATYAINANATSYGSTLNDAALTLWSGRGTCNDGLVALNGTTINDGSNELVGLIASLIKYVVSATSYGATTHYSAVISTKL
jgi:hypothetical protein